MKKQRRKSNLGFDFAKWSSSLLMLAVFRPKVHYPFGKPDKKGKLIVSSNHIGALDCVKIAFAFPWRRMWTLTRSQCFKTPFSNWVFRSINCIPVDRDNVSTDTYREILDVLKEEKMVLIFSEGRLNFEGNNLLDYKMGTAFFAAMSGAPVIPVFIVRRENHWLRTHIIVGQKLWIKDICEGVPSMPDIQKFNEYIKEKEGELEKWKDEHMGK